jgi:hypothetical protein
MWQHTRLDGAPIQEHIDPLLSPLAIRRADDGGAKVPSGPDDQ